MDLADHLKSLSHHAYLLVGDQSAREELLSILEKRHKIAAHANPDLFDRTYQTFTIDDAREVRSSAEMRPVGNADDKKSAGKKIFILTMDGITVEAQNALLKLLEEPPEYAHFFLIIPSAHLLLPTVKSRVAVIDHEARSTKHGERKTQNAGAKEEAERFLKMSAPKRLDHIKKLMDDIGKEKKTKQDAIGFLDAIQLAVYEQSGVKEGKLALEAIETARKYATDRAPSMKMLLEYVALSV